MKVVHVYEREKAECVNSGRHCLVEKIYPKPLDLGKAPLRESGIFPV